MVKVRSGVASAIFLASAIVSFNGGLWQLQRRKWKQGIMDSHANLHLPAVHSLPQTGDRLAEFRHVELEGTLDNEGSVIVGPRPCPLTKNRTDSSMEQRGGFIVMTPFEVVGTHEIVMVNRGWVPIDACKGRLHLVKYIGEGFRATTLRGIFRREEHVSSWYNFDPKENHEPTQGEFSWFCQRPCDMALRYYAKRWGADKVEERQRMHGARHYQIEMIEDHSGDDQVMVKDRALPLRRVPDELTHVALTPIIHSMYACFWFSVTIGSLFALRKTFAANYRDAVIRRMRMEGATERVAHRQEEGAAFYADLQKAMQAGSVTRVAMRPAIATTTEGSSAAATAAVAGAAGAEATPAASTTPVGAGSPKQP